LGIIWQEIQEIQNKSEKFRYFRKIQKNMKNSKNSKNSEKLRKTQKKTEKIGNIKEIQGNSGIFNKFQENFRKIVFSYLPCSNGLLFYFPATPMDFVCKQRLRPPTSTSPLGGLVSPREGERPSRR
jgi:hypothetical protein